MSTPWFAALRHAAHAFVREVFVEPVREGSVRRRDWPRGLTGVAIAALVVYVVLMGLVLARRAVLAVFPAAAEDSGLVPALATGAAAVVLVLLYAASLHLALYWRLLIGVVFLLQAVVAVAFAVRISIEFRQTALAFAGLTAAFVGSYLLLGIVSLTRRGKPFALWPVLLASACIAVGFLVPQLLLMRLDDAKQVASVPTWILVAILLIAVLPLAFASGTAFAELTVRTGTWALLAAREATLPRVWPVIALVLAVTHLALALAQHQMPVTRVVITIVVVVIISAVTAMALRLVRRRAPRHPPQPVALVERLAGMALPFSLCATTWVLHLRWGATLIPSGIVTALVATWLTVRSVRAADAVGAALYPALGLVLLWTAVREIFHLPGLSNTITAATLAGWLIVSALGWSRSGLTSDRWFLLSVGLLIALLMPWRQTVAEPFGAVLGFAPVAVLLVGLVWRLLTEAAFTRGDSPAFPRPARVLLFAAQAVMAAAATLVVSYRPDDLWNMFDLERYAGSGDATLGYGALIAVVAGIVELGHFRIDAHPDAHPQVPWAGQVVTIDDTHAPITDAPDPVWFDPSPADGGAEPARWTS